MKQRNTRKITRWTKKKQTHKLSNQEIKLTSESKNQRTNGRKFQNPIGRIEPRTEQKGVLLNAYKFHS